MPKAIVILIDPNGEEWFHAYGPPSKIRDRATRFTNRGVAEQAAWRHFGHNTGAFWESERRAAENARELYRHWTFRIEDVADDDTGKRGFYVARGCPDADRLYQRQVLQLVGSEKRWIEDVEQATLFATIDEANAQTETPNGRVGTPFCY
jgi:hypothetical protein